ncbi:diguanylate cyclase with PAS/PAC sensor [Rhizobium sp. CF080]|uniref:sensor domain-containing diguanylate cyclase n=1 Tax=Rhizobium sp. (strain CF080) TaxID=1144310 RepID=UPI000271C50B|nr:diguanylate cyclase [Rhizobium sp. CF080]EUC00201.1 diguanylate cyclase with PAS/PAC sensor [Rhizobium sp. CF080]
MTGAIKFLPAKTFVAVAFAVFGFLGLIVWGEYSSWKSQVAHIESELIQTAKALVQHADDTVDMAKFPLAALITQIEQERDVPDMPAKITQVMKRQVDTTPWLGALSVVDADGRIVATSSSINTSGINFADREYFVFHQSSDTLEPVLGRPLKSKLSGQWILPVTQRISNPDGSFGGVALAAFILTELTNFFQGFSLGGEGSFLLARRDGVVLARAPFLQTLLGSSISSYDLFTTHLRQRHSGSYHYISPIDDTLRIGGFYQSEHSGMVGLAAASQSEALATWMKGARIRWLSCFILVTITGFLVWRWRRQIMLRRASEALLVAREAEFRLLAEGSGDLIQRFNGHGIREYLSPSVREIFGVDAEAMLGTHILENLHEDDHEVVTQVMDRLREGSTRENMVVRRKRADGKQIWLETTLNRLPGGTGGTDIRIVAVARDVTRQKSIQEELDALANTDELTQLANRRSFNIHFEEMVLQAAQKLTPLSILMIDADRFKFFNDTYGHASGDDCLRALADVVRGSIRRSRDLAARYGGEEIAVLLPDTDGAGALKAAENIRQRVAGLRLPHEKNLPWGYVTISIGTATFRPAGGDSLTTAELFERADHALYRAKNSGRNRVAAAGDEVVVTIDRSGIKSV